MDGVTVFPVDTILLALYLQYLGNSINWFNSCCRRGCLCFSLDPSSHWVTSPADDCFIQALLGELRCMLALPIVKKQPVTSKLLNVMVQACQPDASLDDLRLVAACLLSFAAFCAMTSFQTML